MTILATVFGSLGSFAVVVGFWLLVCASLSRKSGWQRLAGQFPGRESVEAKRTFLASGVIGEIAYSSALIFSMNDEGFGLDVLFPFRFKTPPLFIPWCAVDCISKEGWLFSKHTVVTLRGGFPKISLYGKPGKRVADRFDGSVKPHPRPG